MEERDTELRCKWRHQKVNLKRVFHWQSLHRITVSHFTESIVLRRGKLKRFWIGPLLTFTTVRAILRASFIPVDRYGHPKKVPKKEKVKLLTITCLLVKRKFNEIHKDFSLKGTLIQIWKSANIFVFTWKYQGIEGITL